MIHESVTATEGYDVPRVIEPNHVFHETLGQGHAAISPVSSRRRRSLIARRADQRALTDNDPEVRAVQEHQKIRHALIDTNANAAGGDAARDHFRRPMALRLDADARR